MGEDRLDVKFSQELAVNRKDGRQFCRFSVEGVYNDVKKRDLPAIEEALKSPLDRLVELGKMRTEM